MRAVDLIDHASVLRVAEQKRLPAQKRVLQRFGGFSLFVVKAPKTAFLRLFPSWDAHTGLCGIHRPFVVLRGLCDVVGKELRERRMMIKMAATGIDEHRQRRFRILLAKGLRLARTFIGPFILAAHPEQRHTALAKGLHPRLLLRPRALERNARQHAMRHARGHEIRHLRRRRMPYRHQRRGDEALVARLDRERLNRALHRRLLRTSKLRRTARRRRDPQNPKIEPRHHRAKGRAFEDRLLQHVLRRIHESLHPFRLRRQPQKCPRCLARLLTDHPRHLDGPLILRRHDVAAEDDNEREEVKSEHRASLPSETPPAKSGVVNECSSLTAPSPPRPNAPPSGRHRKWPTFLPVSGPVLLARHP